MPVHRAGRDCWQWGHHGTVYCGPGARAKAERQGRAAYAHGYRGQEPPHDLRFAAGPDAAICVVVDDLGRVLTVSRPEPPHEQAVPGGLVDPGEHPAEAAARELREECAVRVRDLERAATVRSPADGRRVHVFRAGSHSGAARAAEAGTRVAWLAPEELLAQARVFRQTVRELLDGGLLAATETSLSDLDLRLLDAYHVSSATGTEDDIGAPSGLVAQQLGLSTAAVTAATRRLESLGLVEDTGYAMRYERSRTGRGGSWQWIDRPKTVGGMLSKPGASTVWRTTQAGVEHLRR